jgi:hypothetical protein
MTFPRRKISTDDVIEGKVWSQSKGPRAAAPGIHFATCLVNGGWTNLSLSLYISLYMQGPLSSSARLEDIGPAASYDHSS